MATSGNWGCEKSQSGVRNVRCGGKTTAAVNALPGGKPERAARR